MYAKHILFCYTIYYTIIKQAYTNICQLLHIICKQAHLLQIKAHDKMTMFRCKFTFSLAP